MAGQWRWWIIKASLAAGGVLATGLFLLGLPGAIVLDAVTALDLAPNPAPDSAWPLAIYTTMAGAVMIVPASLALRLATPKLAGWAHAATTALLSVVGNAVFAIFAILLSR